MRELSRKLGQKLIPIADSGWIKLFGFGLVTVLTVVAKAFENESTKASIPKPIQDIFIGNPWSLYIADILPLPALALTLFLAWWKSTLSEDQPKSLALLTLLDSLAMAVGKKLSARHHKACLVVGQKLIPLYPIHFSSPLEQIKVLVDGVHKVFQREAGEANMPESQQIKVTLAAMDKQGAFDRFWYYFPANLAPTSPDAFRNRRSGFTAAIEKNDILVIDDIAKELQKGKEMSRYLTSASESGNFGSMIALPIKIDKVSGYPETPLVLVIKCDTARVFSMARINLYRILAEPFVDRIKLEFYNYVIGGKEEVYGDDSTPQGKDIGRASDRSRPAKKTNRAPAQSSDAD